MRALLWMFRGVAVVSALLLIARGIAGPFWMLHNSITTECALAISVICAWLTADRQGRAERDLTHHSRWAFALVPVAAAIGFLPILSMPLVTDDYIHLRQISTGEAPTPLGCLIHSCGGPQSFRPLGFATYWAEWELWDTAAMPRHGLDLILHAISSLLFLLLLRRLGVGPPFDWLAGLFFAWNGIRAEAVAWPSARFDTLALTFSLAAALCVLRGSRIGLIGSVLATAAACLSKESAYVLPVLLALLLGRGAIAGAGRVLIVSNAAVAVSIFAWRWVVLKGIGGYLQPDGLTPIVLQFHPLVLAKTFLARIWGVLWFPVNWSRPLEWWMMLGLLAGAIGSCLLLYSRVDRKRVILCLAGVVVACVPTHHMLLIGPSLEHSRYLDFATPAFTLLVVFACLELPRRAGAAALALLAVFQLAGLEHNLRIWSSVSTARYELCRGVAARARKTEGRITIGDLPMTVDGVHWRNGIEDCLWLEFDIPMGKVEVTGRVKER